MIKNGFNDTIIARTSAHGVSVRAIIRMSGKNSLTVLQQFFDPPPTTQLQPYILDGNLTIWGPQRKIPSTLYYWSNGHGYTGEESVEIHTIGSPPIVDSFIDTVCADGLVRLANRGEFTLRAFLNGRIDLTQAEATLGIIDAESKKSLEFSLQQLAGGIAAPITEIRETLLNALVQIEAGLDFTDEDIEFISNADLRQIVANAIISVEHLRNRLESRGITGKRSKVIIAGLSNAGKSSLFNCLLNRNCAIVSDQIGTTRDYLEAEINLDGIECSIIDTAGIIDNFNNNCSSTDINTVTNNTVDMIAQNYSQKMIELADIIIFCVDSSTINSNKINAGINVTNNTNNLNEYQFNLLNSFNSDIKNRIIVTWTKCDLLNNIINGDWSKNLSSGFGGDFVFVSSVSGYGIDNLKNRIKSKLQSGKDNAIISTTIRCREAIHKAHNALNNVMNLKIQDDSLTAAEIRTAINSLGLIDGTIHTEDILDRIFEQFCIGK
ncbi:MAG: tRNA modification GTPase [Planctomycetaceae bacterium]|jgi:tRNA modification GTPase|nr:tRNA modification GTPase [Planctomycetaceae bacterium]